MIRFVVVLVLAAVTGCAPVPSPAEVAASQPATAEIAPGEVRLRPIAPGVWLHVSTFDLGEGDLYPSNGLVVQDGDSLLVVDPAWGDAATDALFAAIDQHIGLPVSRALSTHFHDDRVAGDDALRRRGIPVFATPLTRRLAAAEGNVVPSDSLVGLERPGDRIRVGPVEVLYPGAGHTRDNVVVYVPAARVLFGGCAVHEASRTTAGNVADADLDAWPVSLRRMQAVFPEARLVIPGHGVPGGPELLARSVEIVEAARVGG